MNSYIAVNKDKTILELSSSGGVFYALAEYILKNNGIVFGASWTDSWMVEMRSIDNIGDLPLLMGSKYIQADVKDTYKECEEYLKQNKTVLYAGLPCQIHGLKNYLKKDYDNLYLVDIACHGLPRISLWKDYLKTIERPDADISSINFRLKDPSWSDYSFSVSYSDNKQLTESHKNNKYMKAFLSDKYLNPGCYNCKFKNKYSVSDLCIGDAWGVPVKSKNGASFIKCLTEKGELLLSKINSIYLKPFTYDNPANNGCLKNTIYTKPAIYDKKIFNKKVAIITLHLHSNIGGILQAYALCKTISDLGYDAEVITKDNKNLPDFARKNINLNIIQNHWDYFKFKPDDYDIYVVGSDQIWRKKYARSMFKKQYINVPFLSFTEDWDILRIAYAASFGVSNKDWEYTAEENKRISSLMKKFDAISVRENASVQDCKNKLNIDVTQCVDPTLFLSKDDYEKLCENISKKKNNVGVYLLDETPEKLNLINNYCSKNNLTYSKVNENTVENWLALFRDSDIIITDSYHGCLFASIFEKPFFCFYNKQRGGARFESLIALLKINHILYNCNETIDLDENNINKVDIKSVSEDIAKSREFLSRNLALPKRKEK